MGKYKRYKSKKKRFRKGKAKKFFKRIKKIARREIFKNTDLKTCITELSLYPTTAQFGTNLWRPIDPPIAAGSTINLARNYNLTVTQQWGYASSPQNYNLQPTAGAGFLLGNTILRTGFKLHMRILPMWTTGTAAPYSIATVLPNNNNTINSNLAQASVRVSLVRPTHGISDADFEADYLTLFSALSFDDPYDKSNIVVIWDKFFTFTASDSKVRVINKKFRGITGRQRLRFPRSPVDGSLLYNWLGNNNLYLLIRYPSPYFYVDSTLQYRYQVAFERIVVTTYYVDI